MRYFISPLRGRDSTFPIHFSLWNPPNPDLNRDNSNLNCDSSSLHHDSSSLHHDSSSLHYDSSSLHYGSSSLHHDSSSLHHDSSSLHHDSSSLHHDSSSLHHDDSSLHHDGSSLHGRSSSLRCDGSSLPKLFRRANGPPYTSLGQSPQEKPPTNPKGLKARPISSTSPATHHLPIIHPFHAFKSAKHLPTTSPLYITVTNQRCVSLPIGNHSPVPFLASTSDRPLMPAKCSATASAKDSAASSGYETQLWLSADKLQSNFDRADWSGATMIVSNSPKGERRGAHQYLLTCFASAESKRGGVPSIPHPVLPRLDARPLKWPYLGGLLGLHLRLPSGRTPRPRHFSPVHIELWCAVFVVGKSPFGSRLEERWWKCWATCRRGSG